jgi:ABC-type arginine transport system permease subunit
MLPVRSVALAVTAHVLNQIFCVCFAIIHETSRTVVFKANTLYAFVLSSSPNWIPVHI